MKLTSKIFLTMIILGFGLLTVRSNIKADWWDRGERPVLPRNEINIPTQQEQPTTQPSNPPQPTSTPPKQGAPQATLTPESGSSSDEDPCASGKEYTGDYCGWSPRIGGNDSGGDGGSTDVYDPGTEAVKGLSYTAGPEIGLSDIMLLSGLLCLALYAKSKFAPNLNVRLQGKRRSR